MRKSMFDTNRDGKLDPIEQAVEMMFIKEVIDGHESSNHTSHSHQRNKPVKKPKSPPTGISFAGMPLYDATKDTPGMTILRSVLVIIFCISGFALPCIFDTSGLGTLFCLFGAVALSMLVMKNT